MYADDVSIFNCTISSASIQIKLHKMEKDLNSVRLAQQTKIREQPNIKSKIVVLH